MSDTIPSDAYVMIIGAMKCGTSSLYTYLKDHPEICPSFIMEPRFFCEKQKLKIPYACYDQLWEFDNKAHKYSMEASTAYTKYPFEPNIPKNIYNYGIKPKFIYLLRNPYDRIISQYNFMKQISSWQHSIDDMHLIDISNYYKQLSRYTQYFERDKILILDFDDLKTNPMKILKKIYLFLGISNCYFPDKFKIVNATRVETKLEYKLRKLKMGVFLNLLPKALRCFARRHIKRISSPNKRLLNYEEKRYIHDQLRSSMCKLYKYYKFDVRKWGFEID